MLTHSALSRDPPCAESHTQTGAICPSLASLAHSARSANPNNFTRTESHAHRKASSTCRSRCWQTPLISLAQNHMHTERRHLPIACAAHSFSTFRRHCLQADTDPVRLSVTLFGTVLPIYAKFEFLIMWSVHNWSHWSHLVTLVKAGHIWSQMVTLVTLGHIRSQLVTLVTSGHIWSQMVTLVILVTPGQFWSQVVSSGHIGHSWSHLVTTGHTC